MIDSSVSSRTFGLLTSGVSPPLTALAAFTVVALRAAPAFAMPSLAEFEAAAQTRAYDNQEARALLSQRIAEARQAWAALIPALTAQADYFRNQYAVVASIPSGPGGAINQAVITPENQRDLTITATVPLIDLARWKTVQTTARKREAEAAQVASTKLDVETQVATQYFHVQGGLGVLAAAERTVKAAEDNVAYLQARSSAGFASELEVLQARGETERDRQAVADAAYTLETFRVALATLTGIAPGTSETVSTDATGAVDLAEEAPLSSWLVSTRQLPSVKAATLEAVAADGTAVTQRAALLPSISGQATERFTNAVGFGVSPYYSVGVVATWKLDLGTYDGAKAADAAAEVLHVREERAANAASDAITNGWNEVRAEIAKCRAARAQRAVSREAVEVAKQKYGAGRVTTLDLIQTQRDDFTAEATLVQAESDLALARVKLRLLAGHPVDAMGNR